MNFTKTQDRNKSNTTFQWWYLYGPSPINAILTPGNLSITLIKYKAQLVPNSSQ
jgi:hypothetical protein